MPVAFHPPLAHAPDAAVAVRGKDDAVDADLFAALLSSAGAAGDVAGATRAAFAAFAGKSTKQAPDDLRGDDAHDRIPASTLDIAALAAFAAAAGVDLAQLAQHAAASPRASASPDASAAAHDATKPVVTKLAPAATPDARMAPSPEIGAPAKDGTTFTLQQAGTTLPMPGTSSAHGDTTPSRNDTRAATAAAARRDAVAALGAASTGEVHATAAAPSAAAPGPVAALAQAALLAQAAGPAASAASSSRSQDDTVALGAPGAAAPTPPAPPLTRVVAEPVGSPGFAPAFAGEVAQLVRINAERAELHLHPAELGPIGIKLHIKDNQVSVAVIAPDSQARDALQQALPQLRDALAQQGMALADASVHDQPRREADPGARDTSSPSSRTGAVNAVDVAAPPTARASLRSRLVDLYA